MVFIVENPLQMDDLGGTSKNSGFRDLHDVQEPRAPDEQWAAKAQVLRVSRNHKGASCENSWG